MSEMNNVRPVGKVRIYACGGAGINIASVYAGDVDSSVISATVFPSFIDTSKTNIFKNSLVNEPHFVITKKATEKDSSTEIDGSGRVRAENIEHTIAALPKIMHEHPPLDMNIVVFSSGGGSGSSIGPVLYSELLSRGQDVVAVVVGVEEDFTSIDNTLFTLKSLDSNVEHFGVPANFHYVKYDSSRTRAETDNLARFFISSMCIMASRRNDEMDTKDINRYLNYHTIPRVNLEPGLTMIEVFTNVDDAVKYVPNVFAMAMVLKDTDQPGPSIELGYKTTGYLPSSDEVNSNFYFTSDVSRIQAITNELSAKLRAYSDKEEVRAKPQSIVSDKDKVVKPGLVL